MLAESLGPRRRWCAMAVAAGLCMSCYKASAVDPKSPATSSSVDHSQWTHFFLYGAIGSYEHDIRELCPEGTSEVETGGNALTGLVSVVTIGLYMPRRINVTCSPPSSARPRQSSQGAPR